MNRCPITYETISNQERYSKKGLKLISKNLEFLKDFPYTAEDQRKQSEVLSSKLSIQGFQPKLSAIFSPKDSIFKIVENGGRYILKPQTANWKHLPENEDLTMKLAKMAQIRVPLHGLIYSKDNSMTYFIKRFDREGQKGKLQTEDFAQLTNSTRDTKYDSSMERVADVISEFCTFPKIENIELLRRTLFSFLVGNEDMHLKNFSLIVKNGIIQLSPAYDLLNSTLVQPQTKEELALPLNGKKRGLTRNQFMRVFATEKLGIPEKIQEEVLSIFKRIFPVWKETIQKSFLTSKDKEKYLQIVLGRAVRLNLE